MWEGISNFEEGLIDAYTRISSFLHRMETLSVDLTYDQSGVEIEFMNDDIDGGAGNDVISGDEMLVMGDILRQTTLEDTNSS